MNHAIACTATDLASIPVSMVTGKLLGKHIHIGCSHDHGGSGWRWMVGEAVGDVGAVPLTVGLQRWAPGAMATLGHGLTATLGPAYHLGAEHSAKRWAKQNSVSLDSPQYKERIETVYHREIEHLPLAAIWSVEAGLGNIATQKWLLGSKAPWWQLGLAKLAGSSVSVIGLLGARAVAPETAQDWDRWTSNHVFLPATRLAARPFGIDTRNLEAVDASSDAWQGRMARPTSEQERGG